MANRFWTVPIIGVYIYSVVILVQFGFNNYFYLPRGLIQSSLVANITFLWDVFSALSATIHQHKVFTIIFSLVIVIFVYLYRTFKEITIWLVTIAALMILYGSYYFGSLLAQSTKQFYTFQDQCSALPAELFRRYIVPITYENKAIVVSIDKDNKLEPGYWLVDITNTSCELAPAYIGNVHF